MGYEVGAGIELELDVFFPFSEVETSWRIQNGEHMIKVAGAVCFFLAGLHSFPSERSRSGHCRILSHDGADHFNFSKPPESTYLTNMFIPSSQDRSIEFWFNMLDLDVWTSWIGSFACCESRSLGLGMGWKGWWSCARSRVVGAIATAKFRSLRSVLLIVNCRLCVIKFHEHCIALNGDSVIEACRICSLFAHNHLPSLRSNSSILRPWLTARWVRLSSKISKSIQ